MTGKHILGISTSDFIAPSYGVKWNGATSACIRTGALEGIAASSSPGDALLPCQATMRRCILSDPGIEQYFTEPDNAYNRLGHAPSLIGTDDAGAANKVSDAVLATGTDDAGTAHAVSDNGVFTAADAEYVGKYVHNTTTDTYALITAKVSNNVLTISADIMASGNTFDIGVLSAPAATYVGHYVHNTTDDTYAMITAKDSDAALSIDVNIMANGNAFEICTAGTGYGGDGQVVVKVNAFYYRFSVDDDGYPNWDISPNPFDGASIHHDFIVGNEYVPYIYVAAYKGSMYDASAGAMTPDANIEVNMYAAGDKLCSLSGQYPKTNEKRYEFRAMAAQRGQGWSLCSFDDWSAIQVLYLVEYADFNSQSMIGTGRTMFSGGSWEAANQGNGKYIGKAGYSDAHGNVTAATNRASQTNISAINTETDSDYHDFMSYRGIEWWGNIWEFVDLININDHVPYVCNDPSDAQDDTTDNYIPLGVTLPASNHYQQSLFLQDRGFLPKTVGAASDVISDYYWQADGWRVVRLGGCADNAAAAGAFYAAANVASSCNHVAVGGRLVYKPATVNTKDYKHEVVMTDDTAWTGVVPMGYEIEKIIFVESGGVASTLDLGTASGGNDIFLNQVIAANTITTVVINKTPSMSARTSLYLNDDDAGSAWGVGTAITAIILMRRVLI